MLVRAPLKLLEVVIERWVLSKAKWIEKKINEVKNRPTIKKKIFVEGEEFWYLGEVYHLRFSARRAIELNGDLFFPIRFLKRPEAALVAWYKKQAEEIIAERVKIYAKQMGLKFSSIKINGAKKRWGSCSHENNLNFPWRLAMVPLETIDYVVVHELAHIAHKNHSADFWNLVKEYYPKTAACRKWLKVNSHRFCL